MDAITTALLQRYGGMKQTPMLLSLAGANPGSVVQPNNPQPNLPGVAQLPGVQNRAPNHGAQSLMDQMMRGGGGADQQPAAPSLDLSAFHDQLNLPYWKYKLFGYTGGAPLPTPTATPFSAANLPNLSLLQL